MVSRLHYKRMKVVNISSPKDVGAGAVTPKFASFRNYNSAFLFVAAGALADTTVLQIRQAKNVAGSGIKALTVDKYGTNLTTNSPAEDEDRWDETDATSSPVSTITLTANTNYIIPIRPASLDVDNDFDCIGAEVEDPGVGANLISIQLFLCDGPEGISGNTRHIPAATVNQMPY